MCPVPDDASILHTSKYNTNAMSESKPHDDDAQGSIGLLCVVKPMGDEHGCPSLHASRRTLRMSSPEAASSTTTSRAVRWWIRMNVRALSARVANTQRKTLVVCQSQA